MLTRVFILLLLFGGNLYAADKDIIDDDGNDISIQVYPADGDLLLIILVDHVDKRDMFENMLNSVQQAGIEIWRSDLIRDYFLPRTSESERTLAGDGVKALLDAAHQDTGKTIILAAYDRLPLALLRGVNLWQQSFQGKSQLSGAILFYPNLFGPAPVAGETPVIDPVIAGTNIPLVIYQPDTGAQRWRLNDIMQALWQAGSPATAYLVPQVRDWYFMGGKSHGTGDKLATQRLPGEIKTFARLMNGFSKPASALQAPAASSGGQHVMELVKLSRPLQAPDFALETFNHNKIALENYKNTVTLVNFWASWCGPCVEEIPSLNALAHRYNNNNFRIVSIDYRETRDEIAEFTSNIPVDFPVLMDTDGKTAFDWKVFSFPSSYLVDKHGMVRYSANRAIDWNTESVWQTIDQLIAEP